MVEAPRIIVLAGPNGSGKSTSAKSILQGVLHVDEFVNADTIAQGLSAFDPETVSMAVGRIMLKRLKDLATARASFAFETTLASRSFAPWISQLIADGYEFHLVSSGGSRPMWLWLKSPSACAAAAIRCPRQPFADAIARGLTISSPCTSC